MNNSVFGKTMENVRKDRDIKLGKLREEKATCQKQIITTKWFLDNLLAIEMKEIKEQWTRQCI